MKKYILMVCVLLSAQLSAEAAEQFVKFSSPPQNALLLTGSNDTIRYSQNDWAGVKMAVDNLQEVETIAKGTSSCLEWLVERQETTPS